MAKTIDVVTSETQLATNSFPLCINPPGGVRRHRPGRGAALSNRVAAEA
jgi:hypothetical protein